MVVSLAQQFKVWTLVNDMQGLFFFSNYKANQPMENMEVPLIGFWK